MTRDEIIRMALDCGATQNPAYDYDEVKMSPEALERFAAAAYAAGKAAERQRILSICNEVSAEWFNYSGGAVECIRRIEEIK